MAERQQATIAYRPAMDRTLEGAINMAIDKRLARLESSMPAKVIKYDPATNTADLQPLSDLIGTDGEKVTRPVINGVRVARPGAGGALVRFPVKEGDVGYMTAGDRDTGGAAANAAEEQPATGRRTSFGQGFFTPDSSAEWKPEDAGATGDDTVIGAKDGSVRISFSAGKLSIIAKESISIECKDLTIKCGGTIKITAEGETTFKTSKFTMDAPMQVTGTIDCDKNITTQADLNVKGKADITGEASIGGNARITGNAEVSGNVNASGTVTGSDVRAGATSLSSHRHIAPSGGGPTGGPIG